VTAIQFFGQDADGLYRGGVVDGRVPADVAEELFRLGWQTATLLREHHQVVGWVRPDPSCDECTWTETTSNHLPSPRRRPNTRTSRPAKP